MKTSHPFLRKQESPRTIPAKAGIPPYHSCGNRNPTVPFLRKQESPHTIPAKAGIPPYHSCEAGIPPYHSCESRNPSVPFLRKQESSNKCLVIHWIPAFAGMVWPNFRAGSQFYGVESKSMILPCNIGKVCPRDMVTCAACNWVKRGQYV